MFSSYRQDLLLGRDSQYKQIQEERKDGEDVNDVHGVLQENNFLRRSCEPQKIFQGEPGHAGGFYQGENGILDQVALQILNISHNVEASPGGRYLYRVLRGLQRVDDHPDYGDAYKGHGHDGDELRHGAALRVLHQVPQELLVARKLPRPEILLGLLQCEN